MVTNSFSKIRGSGGALYSKESEFSVSLGSDCLFEVAPSEMNK